MKQWLRGKYVILIYLADGLLAAALLGRYPAMSVFLAVYTGTGAVMLLEEVYLRKMTARERKSRSTETETMKENSRPVDDVSKKEKICMAVSLTAMLLCLFLPEKSFLFVNLLVCTAIAALLAEMLLRVPRYRRMAGRKQKISAEDRKKKRRVRRRILAVVILCYVLGGAILPFVYQPSITGSTEESFDAKDFYGDGYCKERAKVISRNGEALKERIRLIEQAEDEIILSTLEFDADISGKQVLAALIKAADRGVKVSVLLDGFSYLPQVWWNPYFLALARMEQVEIRVYNTPDVLRPWTAMGRLHDKYLIADNFAYILGGRNTYDFFLGDQPGYKNYDWDVLVYREEEEWGSKGTENDIAETESSGKNTDYEASISQVKEYYEQVSGSKDCRLIGKSRIWNSSPAVSDAGEELEQLYETMKQEHGDWFETPDYEAETLPVQNIRLVSNPTHIFSKEPVVYYTITELMKQAQEEVVFHTPYIVCNDWMLERLRQVCSGAAKVWMMTNSVANNGNPFGALDYQKYKEKILDTGVQIMEYDGGISYHGKCFVIDDRLSAIGSFNWDMRSAYLDTELMLVIDSEPVNEALREAMGQYEKDALRVIDEKNYDLPEGRKLQKISRQRDLRIRVLGPLVGWARFLM